MKLSSAAVVAGAMALCPTAADASNSAKDRVPVLWSATECLRVVDRSVVPVTHFEYTVPYEDPAADGMLTEDEVADSRRHQFFAFARQRYSMQGTLPLFITSADLERADAMDDSEMYEDVTPDQILEDQASGWTPADWTRITPDDMRVPITFAQAMLGVDWDTSTTAPGTWLVVGYTWEPKRNLWSVRWGGVKVVASADAIEDAGPSVILQPHAETADPGTAVAIPGCTDAPAASTLVLDYGIVEGSLEPEWIPIETREAATAALDWTFAVPAELAGRTLWFRATITDPAGRSYVAYGPSALTVTGTPVGETAGDDADPDEGSESAGSSEEDDDETPGCSCTTTPRSAALPVLILFSLPRRRRGATLPP